MDFIQSVGLYNIKSYTIDEVQNKLKDNVFMHNHFNTDLKCRNNIFDQSSYESGQLRTDMHPCRQYQVQKILSSNSTAGNGSLLSPRIRRQLVITTADL